MCDIRLEKYELAALERSKVFEFINTGRKGQIRKRVVFVKEKVEDLYSLEFGDANTGPYDMDYRTTSDKAIQLLYRQQLVKPLDPSLIAILQAGYMR